MLADQVEYYKLLNKTFMNIKNLEFLKESLRYLGFGDKLNTDLEANIKQQPAAFQLSMTGEFKSGEKKDQVQFSLDFKKSDQTDMYFFNKYTATLKQDDPANEKAQTFYITKTSGITAKEAFNLLSGRAVHKELLNAEEKPYKAWLQIDFSEKDKNDNFKIKQFHSGYGFNIDEVITRYPIKEMANAEQAVKILKSLDKGNLQQVTFIKDGKDEKMFIEASPQFKSLNVYDAGMKKIFQGVEKREVREPEKAQEKKEALKQESDDEPSKTEKKTRKRGVGV
jgi:hypothetical protein